MEAPCSDSRRSAQAVPSVDGELRIVCVWDMCVHGGLCVSTAISSCSLRMHVQCLWLGQHCILQLHAHVSPMGHPPCVTSPVPSHVVVTGRQNSFRSLEGVAARTSTALERLADAFSSRNVKRRVLGRWARAARDRKTARSLVKRWCARLPCGRS